MTEQPETFTGDIIEITPPPVLESLERAQIDMQIEHAMRYPRNLDRFIEEARRYALHNQQIADGCFYSFWKGKGSERKLIMGKSVRLAEICFGRWRNSRAGARILDVTDREVVAQGVVHDLETNTFYSGECRRSIKNRKGERYSPDMITMTANAASSIAFRNAVWKMIPEALVEPIYQDAMALAAGDGKPMAERITALQAWLRENEVAPESFLAAFNLPDFQSVTEDVLIKAHGLRNAIKQGEMTKDEAFPEPGASAAGFASYRDLKNDEAPNCPCAAQEPGDRVSDPGGHYEGCEHYTPPSGAKKTTKKRSAKK